MEELVADGYVRGDNIRLIRRKARACPSMNKVARALWWNNESNNEIVGASSSDMKFIHIV